jgi:LmbE family N-acetylglucosaminyl deacetylase
MQRHLLPKAAVAVLALAAGCALSAGPAAGAEPAPSRTILAIFAHPDDDATVGPLLAHYAKQGVRVHLAIVTSGQQGVTAHAKIPAGSELAAVREAEARAACKAYGIEEPDLLGEQDGTLGTMKRHDAIVARLRAIIKKTEPSVILTFGPDGITGHADHRAVGNMVSEIFQGLDAAHATGPVPAKLYYVAIPSSRLANLPANTPVTVAGTVSDAYITTVVNAQDGLEAAARAEACYKSQYTPEGIKFVNGLMANVLRGNVSLRLAFVRAGHINAHEKDIFQNLP